MECIAKRDNGVSNNKRGLKQSEWRHPKFLYENVIWLTFKHVLKYKWSGRHIHCIELGHPAPSINLVVDKYIISINKRAEVAFQSAQEELKAFTLQWNLGFSATCWVFESLQKFQRLGNIGEESWNKPS